MLGAAIWTVLTAIAVYHLQTDWQHATSVDYFGVVGLALLSMACISAWCTLLMALVINWLVPGRRQALHPRLIDWTKTFLLLTATAIVAVVFFPEE